jgi:hypothetical protein
MLRCFFFSNVFLLFSVFFPFFFSFFFSVVFFPAGGNGSVSKINGIYLNKT